jgi:two-component system sensor kinase FixL
LVREIVDDIVTEERRANAVINRVRAQVKKSEVRFEPLACATIISEVIDFLGRELRSRQVAVEVVCADDTPMVSGDRIQVQQVLINLVINAADAMRECEAAGRRVVVQAGRGEPGSVEIQVIDHGTGIPAEVLPKIFTPFFTTKGDGLGMGLGISRTIVEAHGGQLWAENHAGGGAVFHLVLPVA